jgi:hypothetical protein
VQKSVDYSGQRRAIRQHGTCGIVTVDVSQGAGNRRDGVRIAHW